MMNPVRAPDQTTAETVIFHRDWSLKCLLAGLLILLLLPVGVNYAHAQDASSIQEPSPMKTLSDSSLREVTGKEGLSFDTITVDGAVEEKAGGLIDEEGAGIFVGPVTFHELVIGAGEFNSVSGAQVGGESRDDAQELQLGPIFGGVSAQFSLGSGIRGPENEQTFDLPIPEQVITTPMGTIGIGGVNSRNATVEIATN